MRRARAPFLVRRMMSSWLLLSSLMLTVLITSALMVALASFDAQVLPQAVRRALARSPQTSVMIAAPVNATVAAADQPAVAAAMRTAFGQVPLHLDSALWSNPLGLTAAAGSRDIPLAEAAAPGRIRAHAELVSGSWPGRPQPGRPIPAALPAAAGAQLGLAPGAVLDTRDRDTGTRVAFRVSGLFRPRDPASRYWGLDLIDTSGISVQPGFTSYGPLVVSAAAFGRGPLAVGQASWVVLPDPARIEPGGITALAARIRHAATGIQGAVRLGGLQVTTGMPALLDGLSRNVAVARSLLVISALQLLLLAAAALGLAGRLLSGHREEENALLSSRGAGRWQLARITVTETLLVAALAAAAGALLGGWLASMLARAGSLRGAGLRLAGFPAPAWLAAALAVALCLVVTGGPALRPVMPGAARIRRGRPAAIAGIARAGGDIALVVLALIAVRELRAYSAVAHLSAGGLGIDPVLALAPALALAAVALILLRLLPALARLLEYFIARSRLLGAALASWEISRRAIRQSGPVLLAVLAVATSTLALAQYQTWQQSARDQAAFAVGADVRVDTPGPVSPAQAGVISHAPGVTGAMAVSSLPASSGGTILAVDARHAARTVLLRPDLSAVPPAALWRRITPAARSGLALPGRPARLQVVASMAAGRGAPHLGQVTATATIQDASGIAYTIPAGIMLADGHRHALVAWISHRGAASYPLRLVGLSLTYSLPPFPQSRQARLATRRAAAVTIFRVAAAPARAGRSGPPPASGAALARWQGRVSGASLANLDSQGMVAGDVPPRLASLRASAGGSLRLTLDTGNGPSGAVLAKNFSDLPVTGYSGTVTLAPRAPARVIAGIASRAFLAGNRLHVGSTAAVTMAQSLVPVRIVAAVGAVPTTGAGGALVVDQEAVQDVLASRAASPLPVTQWWLHTVSGAVPPGLPAGAAVLDRARRQAALLGDVLSAAPLLEGLAIAAAAALLAAVGFSVSVGASLRARRSQSALLAALGYSRSAQARGHCLEELMLTGPAALAGLGVGVGLAHLLIPAITLTASAAAPVPAVQVTTPLGWAALLTLAVAATPMAVAAAAVVARPDPAAQLRAAEAA